jgi:hypothetical protein
MTSSSLIGKVAPAFTLKNHDGTDYEFKPEGGAPTAIFFYPKSGTYLAWTLDTCDKLTAIQGLMDAPGRHVNSEMHSSVDNCPSFLIPARISLPGFNRERCVQGVEPSSDRYQPRFSRRTRHIRQETKANGELS